VNMMIFQVPYRLPDQLTKFDLIKNAPRHTVVSVFRGSPTVRLKCTLLPVS
jgi:hypothetical protein